MFYENFDKYICKGNQIETEVDGFTLIATIEKDTDYHIDMDDCHNTDQGVTGCDNEQQKKLLAARQAWFNDEWFYGCLIISISKNNVVLHDHAGIMCAIVCNYPGGDNSHIREIANETVDDVVETGKSIVRSLCS